MSTVKKNARQVKEDAALLADVHSKADRLVEEFQDTSIYLVGEFEDMPIHICLQCILTVRFLAQVAGRAALCWNR